MLITQLSPKQILYGQLPAAAPNIVTETGTTIYFENYRGFSGKGDWAIAGDLPSEHRHGTKVSDYGTDPFQRHALYHAEVILNHYEDLEITPESVDIIFKVSSDNSQQTVLMADDTDQPWGVINTVSRNIIESHQPTGTWRAYLVVDPDLDGIWQKRLIYIDSDNQLLGWLIPENPEDTVR